MASVLAAFGAGCLLGLAPLLFRLLALRMAGPMDECCCSCDHCEWDVTITSVPVMQHIDSGMLVDLYGSRAARCHQSDLEEQAKQFAQMGFAPNEMMVIYDLDGDPYVTLAIPEEE